MVAELDVLNVSPEAHRYFFHDTYDASSEKLIDATERTPRNRYMTENGIHGHDRRYRREDDRLLRGGGRYSDDIRLPGQAAGVFVRSPHACAKILSMDFTATLAAPGIVGVLTGADLRAAGVGIVSKTPPLEGLEGPIYVTPRPSLAEEYVRHVGDPVALIVAETQGQAQDASDLVEIDYQTLDAVSDAAEAAKPGAPQVWPEAPGNHCVSVLFGDQDEVLDPIFRSAPKTVRIHVTNQRISGAPMEPRAATTDYDAAADRLTLRAGSQSAGTLRNYLLPELGLEPRQLRVLSDDVGGAFGLKTPSYPEYAALLIAAKKFGRPVHWTSSRLESFMSDNQARDVVADMELALDESGKFLALRGKQIVNMGAYLSVNSAHIATASFARCLPGMYDIPRIGMTTRCVFTHTLPTGPYRGAGRPEAIYSLERLVEKAAREMGMDPVEIRRINAIRNESFPYKTAVQTVFDRGAFQEIIDKARRISGYDGFEERRKTAAAAGKRRGIGVACFVEHSGATPFESSNILFKEGDRIEVQLGSQSAGQGHHAIFADIVGERFGIDPEQVAIRQGDSDFEIKGYASVGSRTGATGSAAIVTTVEKVLEKARPVAATMLEAAAADLTYRLGHFEVVGTDRKVSLFAVAGEAGRLQAAGERDESLDTKATTEIPQTFPNGCHVAEVEIDPETGHVDIVSYHAVDDSGVILDHTIVDGQVVGGIVQSIGQVLLEKITYDPASGQLMTASFMDYGMPRAADLPSRIEVHAHIVPSTTNPLGVKGVGEAGTTGGLAAVMIAITNALPDMGDSVFQLPASTERVWRACAGLPLDG